MMNFSLIAIIIALCLLLATLIGGLISMVRGTARAGYWSQKFMQYRVIVQGVAVLLLFIAFMFSE